METRSKDRMALIGVALAFIALIFGGTWIEWQKAIAMSKSGQSGLLVSIWSFGAHMGYWQFFGVNFLIGALLVLAKVLFFRGNHK